MTAEPTPAQLGYRWPAEWSPQSAVWLAWPHNPDTWPGKFERIPAAFARFAAAVARFGPVRMLCPSGHQPLARQSLQQAQAGPHEMTLLDVPTNDAWIRDYGPTFLSHPTEPSALIDWRYNAWGGKYPPYDLDRRAAAEIARRTGRRRFAGPLTLEGGALEGNGDGVVLTTASSLLDPRRNPNVDRRQAEQVLREMLGVEEVGWLPGGGLAGDDTDGHVDQLARFVDEQTVVVAVAGSSGDPNHAALADCLGAAKRLAAKRWEVVPLPTPAPRWCQGRRLPCSYCNFLFVNGGLLVPLFDDPADDDAIELLGQLRPDREVVGVPAVDLVWGLGALHCLSQQEPLPTGAHPAQDDDSPTHAEAQR